MLTSLLGAQKFSNRSHNVISLSSSSLALLHLFHFISLYFTLGVDCFLGFGLLAVGFFQV